MNEIDKGLAEGGETPMAMVGEIESPFEIQIFNG